MTCCARPVSARVMEVVYTQPTLFGEVSVPQGRRVVFEYEDGSASFLAETYINDDVEFTHAQAN